MDSVKALLAALWSWFSAADVTPPAPSAAPQASPKIPLGKIVDAEISAEMGHNAEAQLTFRTEAGLAVVRNRMVGCCGRYMSTAFAKCGWCCGPICSEAHLLNCSKPGCKISLCPKCVRYFGPREIEDRPALCLPHAEEARVTGDFEVDWS